LLVGADGIDSAVRALLFKDAKPRFAGYQYLRALVQYEHPSHPPGHFSFTFGRGDRIGLHNMGRGRMYWFAVIVTPPGSTDGKAGRKAELVERFKDFAPPVPAAIAAAEEAAIGRTDIRDLRPLERWGDGRTILMGDAAHATTPNLGRGASEAIEDAVALARVLGSADGLSDRGRLVSALRSFEELRRRETSVVQTKAWRIGRLGFLVEPARVRLPRVRDGAHRFAGDAQELRVGLRGAGCALLDGSGDGHGRREAHEGGQAQPRAPDVAEVPEPPQLRVPVELRLQAQDLISSLMGHSFVETRPLTTVSARPTAVSTSAGVTPWTARSATSATPVSTSTIPHALKKR
jgi:2-polyprenyl-6-methoxyphenol hydroxylase-like FAD-dependent oxidoreductase